MAAAAIVSTMPSSFVYEDLLSHATMIQLQMVEATKSLDHQCTNDQKTQNQLQSRSLTIIDPYGNPISEKCMDHELLSKVLNKYKKNYIPKYLHQWIKFGTIDQNEITPLKESELKTTVAKYRNGHQLITCGEVTVWVGYYHNSQPQKRILRVRLIDDMEKIKTQLKERHNLPNIELKVCLINQNERPNEKNWNESVAFNSEDTLMSAQIYQENSVIMAKISNDKVNCNFFF